MRVRKKGTKTLGDLVAVQKEIAELYIAGVNHLTKMTEYTYSPIVRLQHTQEKIQVVANRDRDIIYSGEGGIIRVFW